MTYKELCIPLLVLGSPRRHVSTFKMINANGIDSKKVAQMLRSWALKEKNKSVHDVLEQLMSAANAVKPNLRSSLLRQLATIAQPVKVNKELAMVVKAVGRALEENDMPQPEQAEREVGTCTASERSEDEGRSLGKEEASRETQAATLKATETRETNEAGWEAMAGFEAEEKTRENREEGSEVEESCAQPQGNDPAEVESVVSRSLEEEETNALREQQINELRHKHTQDEERWKLDRDDWILKKEAFLRRTCIWTTRNISEDKIQELLQQAREDAELLYEVTARTGRVEHYLDLSSLGIKSAKRNSAGIGQREMEEEKDHGEFEKVRGVGP